MKTAKLFNWIKSGAFLYNSTLAAILWFGLSLYACIFRFVISVKINNFLIFRHSFYHVLQQKNLYLFYPAEYGDQYLYGPVFSALIAPFAILPVTIGAILWGMFNTAFLFYAINKLPVAKNIRNAILIICSIEMMNNAAWCQVNPFITGCIIFGFAYTCTGKEMKALFFILLAGFIKVYGLAGLAFFFFSENKLKYIMWAIIWGAVFFCLPMLYTSPLYIVQCYSDWYYGLLEKSVLAERTFMEGSTENISVQGMVSRIFGLHNFNSLIIIIPALLLFAAQYLRWNFFADKRYQLYILCSALLFTVIFSSGSEAPTYIIAVPGLCLWFLIHEKQKWSTIVFIFAVIITIFGYSDLLTPYFRTYIMMPYSLKAFPCFVVWMIVIYEIYTKRFLKAEIISHKGTTEQRY